MEQLFGWWNVIFYIPLTFGLLMAVGAAFGLGGDSDHDAEAGHDHDAGGHDHDGHGNQSNITDHDHDHGGHEGKHGGVKLLSPILSVLGVGKVPLSIVLMIAGCVFGGAGIVMNMLLAPVLVYPAAYAWISVLAAFAAMTVFTGQLAGLINRIMPTTESYNITRADLCGVRGQLVLAADERSGLAIVKDQEGTVHNLHCRTKEGDLPKNAKIVVVDYDEVTSMYLIVADPTAENDNS